MKIDKEFLLKNRFWVMAAAVSLWLIGLAIVLIGPGATAAAARKAVEDEEGKLKPKGASDPKNEPKNERFLLKWNERRDFYQKHKDTVWGEAWKTQTDLMSWPEGKLTRTYGN